MKRAERAFARLDRTAALTHQKGCSVNHGALFQLLIRGDRMFAFAAVAYGALTSFVVASVSRNRREARSNPIILAAFGWLLMAFSATAGVGLLGYASYSALSGNEIAAI
jgi:hypothetical protein